MSPKHWKIRVISLETDEERREPLVRKLGELGLDFEVFLGVDGRNGLPPKYEAQIDRVGARKRKRRPLSDGELACSLSHRMVYETMLRNGEEGCIILEDDAIIGPSFAEFVKSGAYRSHPMLMLDYGPVYTSSATAPLFGDVVTSPIMLSPDLATGYTVSRESAKMLVHAATPVDFVADWPCSLRDLSARIVIPRLVDHPEKGLNSTLDDARSKLEQVQEPKPRSRYLTLSYWRNWFIKHRSQRLKHVPFRM